MGRTARLFQLGLITFGIFAFSNVVGCQPNESGANNGANGGTGGTGADGGGAAGAGTSAGGAGGTGGRGMGASGGTGGSGAGTTGSQDPCSEGATEVSVYQITNEKADGHVGADAKVSIKGVIAMSGKQLISHSKTNMDCLWGVFVSAPKTAAGGQLTETEAYSGTIILSKGGGGQNPIADKASCYTDSNAMSDAIPDDIKPGDVLDVVGTKELFLLDFLPTNPCGSKPTDTDIKTIQIADACKAEKVGTAAVPAPHEFTAEETELLAEQHSDVAGTLDFKRAWGNTKVKVTNWAPELWPASGGNPGGVTGPFGIIRIAPFKAEIHDGFYYRNGSSEVCETAPKFADTAVMFKSVQGFHYLDFCTWAINNDDKCADFDPQTDDCKAASIAACIQ